MATATHLATSTPVATPTVRPTRPPVDPAAARRDEASNQAIDLVSAVLLPIETNAPPGTGISYGISDLAHRRLDLWWVGPQPAALRRLAANAGHGVTVVVHVGTRTEAELDAVAGRVFSQWKAVGGADRLYRIASAGYNVHTGRIDVVISTPDRGPVPAAVAARVRALDIGLPIGTVTEGELAVAAIGAPRRLPAR